MTERYLNPMYEPVEVGAIDTNRVIEFLDAEFETTRERLIWRGSTYPSDHEVYEEMRDYYYQCISGSPLQNEWLTAAVAVSLEDDPLGGDIEVGELMNTSNHQATFEFGMGAYFAYVELMGDLVAKELDVDECETSLKPFLMHKLPAEGYTVQVDWLRQQGNFISATGRMVFDAYASHWQPVLDSYKQLLSPGEGELPPRVKEGIGYAIYLLNNGLKPYVEQHNKYLTKRKLDDDKRQINEFQQLLNSSDTLEDFGLSE